MDFVAYWAATRLLLSGGNPYSTAALYQLQSSVGLQAANPMVMWNPPWTLTFSLPFGLVDFSTGQMLWLLVCTYVLSFRPRSFGEYTATRRAILENHGSWRRPLRRRFLSFFSVRFRPWFYWG